MSAGLRSAAWGLAGALIGLALGAGSAASLYRDNLLPDEAAFGDGVLTLLGAVSEGGLIGAAAGILLGLWARGGTAGGCEEGERGRWARALDALILAGVIVACALFLGHRWSGAYWAAVATALLMASHWRR